MLELCTGTSGGLLPHDSGQLGLRSAERVPQEPGEGAVPRHCHLAGWQFPCLPLLQRLLEVTAPLWPCRGLLSGSWLLPSEAQGCLSGALWALCSRILTGSRYLHACLCMCLCAYMRVMKPFCFVLPDPARPLYCAFCGQADFLQSPRVFTRKAIQ